MIVKSNTLYNFPSVQVYFFNSIMLRGCFAFFISCYALYNAFVYQFQVPSSAMISKKMKLKFSKAWMAFLTLPLPLDVYKEVLCTDLVIIVHIFLYSMYKK